MQKMAFVLLSGGIDSTTCLYKAMKDNYPGLIHPYDLWVNDRLSIEDTGAPPCDWVQAVSIFYGQRHKRELESAATICKRFGIKHTILDVGDLLKGSNILLSGDSVGKMEMVHCSYDDIKGVSPSYVPFRNGLLLSAITAHAQKYVNAQIEKRVNEIHANSIAVIGSEGKQQATTEAKDLVTIYYGAHAEDAANWAYPDCTPEFNGSMANAIYTGSYNTIRLATPLQWLGKADIVKLGTSLHVDYVDTWSCYDGGEKHCGKCPTCRARHAGFVAAGVGDPTIYETTPE